MTRDPAGLDCGRPWVVDAGGPVVCRRWSGPDEVVLVCVHGVMATSLQWIPVAAELRRWGTVVAPDLPGYGHTPLNRRSGLSGMGQAVSGVIEGCRDRPVVLVATSMGAAVAVGQAAALPHSVAALVLGSGYLPAYFGGWRAPAIVSALLAEQVGNLGRGVRSTLLRSALGIAAPEDKLRAADAFGGVPGARRPSARERRRTSARALLSLALMAVTPWRTRGLYGQVSCPVLLLHGMEDSTVPAEWAYRTAASRGWDLHTLPAVGHVVKLGSPGWWVAEVARWLTDRGLVDPGRAEADDAEGVVGADVTLQDSITP